MQGKQQLTIQQKHGLVESVTNAGVLLSEFAIPRDPAVANPSLVWTNVERNAVPTSIQVHPEAVWCLVGSMHGDIYLSTVRFDQGHIHAVLKGHGKAVSALKLIGSAQDALMSASLEKTIKVFNRCLALVLIVHLPAL